MKKIVALAMALAMALVLVACAGGTLAVSSDDSGAHAQATGLASGSGSAYIAIEKGYGLCINHIVDRGAFHVKVVDKTGKVVFDKDITNNIADMIDVQGEFDIIIAAKDATGTIDIIPYDKAAMAQADATMPDMLKSQMSERAQ